MQKVCLGFHHLFTGPGPRCAQHAALKERDRERIRGNRYERGYGAEHYKARERLAITLPDLCGYCHKVIVPAERWVAAHVEDGNPDKGWMVSHVGCNERAKRRYQATKKRPAEDGPRFRAVNS